MVTINASLITGLYAVSDIAAWGGYLYVGEDGGTIAQYTTAGSLVNATFISVPAQTFALATSGGNLFVLGTNGTVAVYNATTGAVINAALVTGLGFDLLDSPVIAVSGSDLYVTQGSDSIAEYNATTGAVINVRP